MRPLLFFRRPDVQRTLARAARAAGTPLALHYVTRGEEGPVIARWGGCEACARVNACAEGKNRCRASRLGAAATALRQQRGIPFICHVGFTCIAVPALAGERFILTFGPFAPAHLDDLLEERVQTAYQVLQPLPETENAPAFDLRDVHRAPEGSIYAAAEWLREDLARCWREAATETAREAAADTVAPPEPDHAPGRRRVQEFHAVPYQATETALALAGGQMGLVRDILEGLLGEAHGGVRPKPSVRRARILAAAAAAIEAAERVPLDTSRAWSQLGPFIEQIESESHDSGLLEAALRLLRGVKPGKPSKPAPPVEKARLAYKEINRLVIERLPDSIALSEVANHLGLKASTISKRLKRQFGMSYYEYVGRLRIDQAKELLRRTSLSATAVAHRVGIRDQSHFSKLFKKFEGITPSEYRGQYGKRS